MIDARVLSAGGHGGDAGSVGNVAVGAGSGFTLYELEVHTTRGVHTRHRRFSAFLAAHREILAALNWPQPPGLPDLSKKWSGIQK